MNMDSQAGCQALGLRRRRQALTVREKEPDLKLVQPIPVLT